MPSIMSFELFIEPDTMPKTMPGMRNSRKISDTIARIIGAVDAVRSPSAARHAESAGSAASCLDTVVDYLKTRKQFGKLIGSYQALKHPTVEILTGVDSSRSFVYHAASLVAEGPLDKDAEIACRMAKAQATDTLLYAGDRAVQFHGGMGFTWEFNCHLYYRRAQSLALLLGGQRIWKNLLVDRLQQQTAA